MSHENDNEVELSPGFFDLNNPINNDDISESIVIPEQINVENSDTTKNFVVEFFTLMILNTSSKPCGCSGDGWSRTSTY